MRSDAVPEEVRKGQCDVSGERVSRFTVFLRNNDRQSRPIMKRLIRTLNPLPAMAGRSITFDRGTECTD
jgi:IS30 family transposase